MCICEKVCWGSWIIWKYDINGVDDTVKQTCSGICKIFFLNFSPRHEYQNTFFLTARGTVQSGWKIQKNFWITCCHPHSLSPEDGRSMLLWNVNSSCQFANSELFFSGISFVKSWIVSRITTLIDGMDSDFERWSTEATWHHCRSDSDVFNISVVKPWPFGVICTVVVTSLCNDHSRH
jgi:hypothetical protein